MFMFTIWLGRGQGLDPREHKVMTDSLLRDIYAASPSLKLSSFFSGEGPFNLMSVHLAPLIPANVLVLCLSVTLQVALASRTGQAAEDRRLSRARPGKARKCHSWHQGSVLCVQGFPSEVVGSSHDPASTFS